MDYQAALDYTDDNRTKSLYKEEATYISEVQRDILAISQKEEPYDIFICYKETDATGNRTKDSALAQDVYYQLIQEGYKVFFSRITLEDKLGQAYEPYIFAALSSAKVMVVIGTKPEYYNTVWVKNEWSRYLARMKKNKSLLLIPCYRGMDAYDLPEELSLYQSQDMGKIGFVQDLVRGVRKVLDATAKQTVESAQVIEANTTTISGVESLLKRIALFLEDEDWQAALEYCEKVLDLDAECAMAYVYRLCSSLKCSSMAVLEQQPQRFNEHRDYQKALRFSSTFLKKQLEQTDEIIKLHLDEQRKQNLYDMGIREKSNAKFTVAEEIFSSIPDYKDSQIQINECKQEQRLLLKKQSEERVKVEYNMKINKAKRKKVVATIASVAIALAICSAVYVVVLAPIFTYNKANEFLKQGQYDEAAMLFSTLGDYKDSHIQFQESSYEQAISLQNNGQQAEAAEIFSKLNDYKDSAMLYSVSCYEKAVSSQSIENYVEAAMYFTKAGDYKDASILAEPYVLKWREAEAKTISAGRSHTVGIKTDGTAVTTKYIGDEEDYEGQCEIMGWTDVMSIATNYTSTAGLKIDGSVVITEYTGGEEICADYHKVSEWRDIVAISTKGICIAGLKSDGSVVAIGAKDADEYQISDWTNIVSISAHGASVVGLKSDGTVVSFGVNSDIQKEASDWTDIVAISNGSSYIIGLKSDGTVVSTAYIDNVIDYGYSSKYGDSSKC